MTSRFDIAIIGSGFSGSILARILAKAGRKVALIDSARHPRFAIGESSTPIADLLLKQIAASYDLPELNSMSTFGSWQERLKQLPCGLKRGFSYFDHRDGLECKESTIGQRSLVVAASPSERRGDTHWYRPDVDSFLFDHAVGAGVEPFEDTSVLSITKGTPIRVGLSNDLRLETDFLVDATGPSAAVAKLLQEVPCTSKLETNTSVSFAHFQNVNSFSEHFRALSGQDTDLEPFDPDDAAQHHLIDNGWAWMLRMNNGVTSVGCVQRNGEVETSSPSSILASRFAGYPSLHQTISHANLVAPVGGIVTRHRIQQFYNPVIAQNIVLMPTSALTLDPLHSTGIAHALGGVQRVAKLAMENGSVQTYQDTVVREARFLDDLVSTAYSSMHSFDRFCTACMVYFSAAICCEERIIAGDNPRMLWNCDNPEFVSAVEKANAILKAELSDREAIDRIRQIIAPWNTAGLLDESLSNRYRYTATK